MESRPIGRPPPHASTATTLLDLAAAHANVPYAMVPAITTVLSAPSHHWGLRTPNIVTPIHSVSPVPSFISSGVCLPTT